MHADGALIGLAGIAVLSLASWLPGTIVAMASFCGCQVENQTFPRKGSERRKRRAFSLSTTRVAVTTAATILFAQPLLPLANTHLRGVSVAPQPGAAATAWSPTFVAAASQLGVAGFPVATRTPTLKITRESENSESYLMLALTRDQQAFLDACAKSKNKEVQELLRQGVNVTTQDDPDSNYAGRTCLHWAADENNEELGLLLTKEYGANPNVQDEKGDTPLLIAAGKNSKEVAKVLLDYGADPNAVDKNGHTPLHRAAEKYSKEMATVLLDHGADPNASGKDGETPLHWAAYANSEEIAAVLLDYGADPNAVDKNGDTPLHGAAERNSNETGTVLLDHGANPNASDEYGETPLHWAAHGNCKEIATVLLDHGADPNAVDKNGDTPLHRAADENSKETATVLLDHGANPSSANKVGVRPLGMAVERGFVEMAYVLLKQGAIGRVAGQGGERFLCFLAKANDLDRLMLLLENRTQYDVGEKAISNTLFCAESANIVHALVDAKADLTVLDKDGNTVVDAAAVNNMWKAVAALLSRGAKMTDKVKKAARHCQEHFPGYRGHCNGIAEKAEAGYTEEHWAAYFCDAYASLLIVSAREGTAAKAKDGATPYSIAENAFKINGKCPGVYSMLHAFQVMKDKGEQDKKRRRDDEKRRRDANVVVGLLVAFGGAGSLGTQILVLWLKTLNEKGCAVPFIPLAIFSAGAFVVTFYEPAGYTAAKPVGYTALSLCTTIAILVALARPGSLTLRLLTSLKRRSTSKFDSLWCVVDCVFIGVASFCMVGTELLHSKNDPVQLCTGILYFLSASAAWLGHVTHTDPATTMRCVGGIISLTLACIFYVPETRTLTPAPATVLVASAMLASASVRLVPGVAQRARQLINIELQTFQDNKFATGKMVFGRGGSAAGGVEQYLDLSYEQIANGLADGIGAMEKEIQQYGDEDDVDNFGYVAHRCSLKPEHVPKKIAETLRVGTYHGGAITPDEFDTGHAGRELFDWMELEEIKIARLTEAEFVAVRFYTSPSFWRINGPLRRGEKHPWPMVVYFLSSGIKKLRGVQAQLNPERFAAETTLWRGMKNLELDIDEFKTLGGTELAPMSTTTCEDVAKHYAQSKVPLVFKYKVSGLKAGVCIQFLSLYPKEQEYVYPPLTYLTYCNHFQDDDMTVVVVEPVMS